MKRSVNSIYYVITELINKAKKMNNLIPCKCFYKITFHK